MNENERRPKNEATSAVPAKKPLPSLLADFLTRTAASRDPWWYSPAVTCLDVLIESGRPFTVHQLPDMGVPSPHHPSQWGALIAGAQRQGRIQVVGATVSNGKPVRVWQGVPA